MEAGLDPFFATVRPPTASRCSSTASTTYRCAGTRSAATRPGCWPGCSADRRDEGRERDPRPLRDWAERTEREASDVGGRERATREREFADFYASHDRVLRDCGSLDAADLVIELGRLVHERSDVRGALSARFRHVMVDELEDAGLAHRRLIEGLAAEHGNLVCACDTAQAIRRAAIAARDPAPSFLELHPEAEHVVLDRPLRFGGLARGQQRPSAAWLTGRSLALATKSRYMRGPCRHASAQTRRHRTRSGGCRRSGSEDVGGVIPEDAKRRMWAGAEEAAEVFRSISAEGSFASGAAPTSGPRRRRSRARSSTCSRPARPRRKRSASDRRTRDGARAARWRRRWRSAAIPFHLAGPAALFQRPEVRDAIAWLRVLADPDDSAAAARALTRPPVELRSVDLARLTTIARRRKLDMVSALRGGAREPPDPARGARADPGLPQALRRSLRRRWRRRGADVFVRRLIERVGLRRQRLFAAQPEVAERLLGLSRLAELATAWARREPHGSTRDFVRHLSAVAEAGELETEDARRRPAAPWSSPSPTRSRAWSSPRLPAGLHRGASPRDFDPVAIPAALGSSTRRVGADRRSRPSPACVPVDDPRHSCAGGVVAGAAARRGPAPRLLQAAPRRAGRRGGDPRGGAVRPRRGPARDLPHAARGGARGVLASRARALGAAPRHRRSTSTGRSPATWSC